ncbi:hypothetical protein NECAME_11347 [Necator americanus]|uniref:Uncharacterized protein n=1 Tax=Necator americanus TaxID=51031 RepID=W2T779_NECAM|nr:hypothetical protein NECAME_11347 [Necator americanus]ETN77026.1 hypothetical protein NECAME_11347 [Necator americanus]
MRWYDVIAKAIASLFCLFLWRFLLHILSAHIPSYSGEEKYFPKQLINDDNALNRYRLNISDHIYPRLRRQADHFSPLEIRIIASDRRQNYLSQVITFLIDAYQSRRRFSPNLEICNVEPEIFDELRKFQLHVPIRTLGKKSSRHLSLDETIAKEASDYWKCLNHTTKGRYVMLLEDDALVVPEFPRMMDSLMDQLDERQHVDYAKLYHPNQLRKIPSIPLFLAELRYYVTNRVYMSIPESCCTPAVVFRASRIPTIISQLSTDPAHVGHAKDHILDESGFVGRQTDMNLVVHIGSVSSIRKRRITLSEVITVVGSVLKACSTADTNPPRLEICNVAGHMFDELQEFHGNLPILSINEINLEVGESIQLVHPNRKSKSRYVLLLEDDVVAIPAFATLLASTITKLNTQNEIDYVKLYHPNYLRGIPSIPLVSDKNYFTPMNKINILFQFLADWRFFLTGSIYLTHIESCCTQAVLFRTSKIPEIVRDLMEEAMKTARVGHAKDHILDESNFLGRQTDKNFVHHIGHISSIRGISSN